MSQELQPVMVFEYVAQSFLERLGIPGRQDMEILNRRLDRLEKLIYQTQPDFQYGGQKKTVPDAKNASAVVLDIITKDRAGTRLKTIKEKTCFNDKKIRNIIYRLDQTGKIERVKRGIYRKK